MIYVNQPTYTKNWTTCIKVLTPALKALCYTDGKKGGTLGLIYSLLLQLDKYYFNGIKGLKIDIQQKVGVLIFLLRNFLHFT